MNTVNRPLDAQYLAELQKKAKEDKKECVVGALLKNAEGKIFLQKRSATADLFPDCWDIAGGHVDPGETFYEALGREIEEETNLKLVKVLDLIEVFDWESNKGNKSVMKREFDFTVEVDGDLENPKIESEYTGFLWVDKEKLTELKKNARPSEVMIFQLVDKALDSETQR